MGKYLLEIKNRLLLLGVTWFSTLGIAYFYKETVLFDILNQNNLTENYFIFTNVTEILMVYLDVIFFFGYQTLYLYLIYHSFIFLTPAFFKTEYFRLKIVCKTIFITYLVSIYFFYYILLPATLNFFMGFQNLLINNSFYLHFEAKIIEYLKFFLLLYQGCILYLQFFACFFLTFNYFVTKQAIKKLRKLFYYWFLILVSVICPPELLIQTYIYLLIILLYEVIVLLFLLKFKSFSAIFNDNVRKDSF